MPAIPADGRVERNVDVQRDRPESALSLPFPDDSGSSGVGPVANRLFSDGGTYRADVRAGCPGELRGPMCVPTIPQSRSPTPLFLTRDVKYLWSIGALYHGPGRALRPKPSSGVIAPVLKLTLASWDL